MRARPSRKLRSSPTGCWSRVCSHRARRLAQSASAYPRVGGQAQLSLRRHPQNDNTRLKGTATAERTSAYNERCPTPVNQPGARHDLRPSLPASPRISQPFAEKHEQNLAQSIQIYPNLSKSIQIWTNLNTSSANSQSTAPHSRNSTVKSPPRPVRLSVGAPRNRTDQRCEQTLGDRATATTLLCAVASPTDSWALLPRSRMF